MHFGYKTQSACKAVPASFQVTLECRLSVDVFQSQGITNEVFPLEYLCVDSKYSKEDLGMVSDHGFVSALCYC